MPHQQARPLIYINPLARVGRQMCNEESTLTERATILFLALLLQHPRITARDSHCKLRPAKMAAAKFFCAALRSRFRAC